MPEHDVLNGLAHELLALPARHRHIIMNALTPAERSRVETLLTPAHIGPKALAANPDDQLVEGHSALIAGRIHAARSDQPVPQKNWKMTPAARQQLLLTAQEVRELERAEQEPATVPPSRTLLGALGGWLAGSPAR